MAAASRATDLLGVVATVLPLLVVLIQFVSRYYQDRADSGSRLAVGVSSIGAVGFLFAAGFGAGEIVRQQTADPALGAVITALELAFLFITVAAVLLWRDVTAQTGEDEDSSDKTENHGSERPVPHREGDNEFR
jgi:H+/gluconate symporter-like permease